jgi:sugar lactone lactonase YvrE
MTGLVAVTLAVGVAGALTKRDSAPGPAVPGPVAMNSQAEREEPSVAPPSEPVLPAELTFTSFDPEPLPSGDVLPSPSLELPPRPTLPSLPLMAGPLGKSGGAIPKSPAPVPPGTLTYPRRQKLGEEDLVKQVARVPEVALDWGRFDQRVTHWVDQQSKGSFPDLEPSKVRLDIVPTLVKTLRPDLDGLPLITGPGAVADPSAVTYLQEGSVTLRRFLALASRPGAGARRDALPHPDPKILRQVLDKAGNKEVNWRRPEVVPALQQLLMAEDVPVREVLVDQLAQIKGKEADKALTIRALFDLNPDVRKRALEALAKRPQEQYREELVRGLTYPWGPVADHAAEALVALKVRKAVPDLVALLDRPDPALPYTRPGSKYPQVRELVRINHMRNCALCHPISAFLTDKLRAFVPTPTQLVAPPITVACYKPTQQGTFVRADITFLRQDFSVPLDVPHAFPWPEVQRFDFLVRERRATREEIEAAKEPGPPSRQRQALFFALRQLTGEDAGDSAADWKRLALHQGFVLAAEVFTEFVDARALALDPAGQVLVADAAARRIFRMGPDGRRTSVYRHLACADLGHDADGRLLALDARWPRLVVCGDQPIPDVLADRSPTRAFRPLHRLALDRAGGAYFTESPPEPGKGKGKGVLYYRSARGDVTSLPCALEKPTALALAPDGKTLYVAGRDSSEVLAYPLASPGVPGKGKVLARLKFPGVLFSAGVAALAVDGAGRVYVASLDDDAVHVFDAAGKPVRRIPLAGRPRDCIVADKAGGRTLYALTATTLYRLDLAGEAFAARGK